MTLSTDMYIQGEVDLDALQQVVQEALAKYDDQNRSVNQQTWEQGSSYSPNSVSTVPGQGLPAWTFIHSGKDGAWRAAEDEYYEDVEEGEEPRFAAPRHFAAIDFDTAYGYQGPNGIDCSQLHALLMHEVADWLEPQGVAWQWRNEYTGDIHDAYDGFEAFIGHGLDAMRWFENAAKPAIERHIAE